MIELLKKRAKIISIIRRHFESQGFIETDTPVLVLSPGMEPHIHPIEIKNKTGTPVVFLQTSPEFAMKKILALGEVERLREPLLDKIFQICKCYRQEPKSNTHHPEFTMIEWYRANSDYEHIMDDVESMFESIETELDLKRSKRPWTRLTVEECFKEFSGCELTELFDVNKISGFCLQKGLASKHLTTPENLSKPGAWDDFFHLIMLNLVEPQLASLKRPVIVYHYPESQAALSNIFTDSRGFKWARRFEVYAGGLELGNAFDELCDAKILRERFLKDMKLRKDIYGDSSPQSPPEIQPESPIDEELLTAVSKLPPSGGIAMGIDRLVMYFTGATNISDVLWQESYWKS